MRVCTYAGSHEVHVLIYKVSFGCIYWWSRFLVLFFFWYPKEKTFCCLKRSPARHQGADVKEKHQIRESKAFGIIILTALFLLIIIFQYYTWIKLGFFALTEKMWTLLASVWRSSCNFWTISCFLCKSEAL